MTYDAEKRIQELDRRINNNLYEAENRNRHGMVESHTKHHHQPAISHKSQRERFGIYYWLMMDYNGRKVHAGPYRERSEAEQQLYNCDVPGQIFELYTRDKAQAKKQMMQKNGGSLEQSENF